MKIILLKDVKNIGRQGEVLEVANGYARNYLIPRKVAKLADPQALAQLAAESKLREAKLQRQQQKAHELAKKLANSRLEFVLPATASGHLYGGLKPVEILAKLKIAGAKLVDYKNLKEVGEHRIKIELMPKIQTEVTIVIKNV